MMNSSVRFALNSSSHMAPSSLRVVLIHSTPVSDRKRRTHWDSGDGYSSPKRFNIHTKRMRKSEAKKVLLRNVSAYAEHLFQSWKTGSNECDSSSTGTSWFRWHSASKGPRRHTYHPHESEWCNYRRRGSFEFVYGDDEEVETIFRSALRGARFSYWSSTGEENFHWTNSWEHSSHRGSSNWRFGVEDDYNHYSSNHKSALDSSLASDRQALGLNISGPLDLEEVKSAYRACALKWHPDRHQGSAKEAAEEKFKRCSVAYQSLCDKLAVA